MSIIFPKRINLQIKEVNDGSSFNYQFMHTLSNRQVKENAQEIIQSRFPEIMINGYQYRENELWDVLLYASVNRLSVKGACDQLKDAPSYNWMYTELKDILFKPYEPEDLESPFK
jgi:hypothetical protein